VIWIALATLPWVLVLGFLVLRVRLPRRLPLELAEPAGGWRRVSVVVPARNEEHNIERVVRSLAASDYPDLEIVVVDDRSDDRTAEVARSVAADLDGECNADIRVVDGEDLPDGWLGKPWACDQGGRVAKGEYVLFTDADTRHAPDLLRRVVAELEKSGADVVSLMGRQLMETFWERVVQPQIFTSLLFRYTNVRDPHPPEKWRDAIANGQYVFFRRAIWEAIGGHTPVKGEVVEDMKMAQHLVRSGYALEIRMAEDGFATRMYENLGELVRGWSKNVILGGTATIPPGLLRRVAPAGIFAGTVFLWLMPPVLLATGLATGDVGVASAVTAWGWIVVGTSALFWGAVSARMGVNPVYGVAYPVGAAIGAWIYLRAWIRGGKVEWKGRTYRVRGVGDPGEPGGLE
jgi:chlorobactene glucosyltransferase